MEAKGRVLTGDIEAVGLLDDIEEGRRDHIHVIHLKDMETDETFTFFDDYEDRIDAVWLDDYEEGWKEGDILDGVKAMEECDVLVFQNISGFDALALEKTVGFKRNHFERINNDYFPFKTADTYTMSCTLNPERKLDPKAYALGLGNIGPHSIKSHGIRMGRHKPEHEDWSHLTKEMIHRCSEDVEIGEDFFYYLMNEWEEQEERPSKVTGMSIKDAYLCEMRIAFTMARQAQRGFAIDVSFIANLLKEIDEKIINTEVAFRPNMPKRIKMKKLSKAQIEKNASIAGIDYENYMLNGDGRASYAATMWDVTTKKGEYKKNLSKYIPDARGYMQDHPNPPVLGAITPLVWEDIPLGNRDAVKQILYKHGWRGVNYNETELDCLENTGKLPKLWSGKIDEDSIKSWEERQEIPSWCKGIAEWYVLCSRRNQICNMKDPEFFIANGHWPRQTNGKNECRGILPKARCKDKISAWYNKTAQDYFEKFKMWPIEGHWRVPAIAFHAATNTFRMRHRVVVNIPSRGLYGKEMRRMFIAAPGHKVLGCDGSGLELRMLAHFMNDQEYIDTVLHGDIHTFNQNAAGLETRDAAKKFIYMFLYGSGIPNLSRQLGIPEHKMKQIVDNFKSNLPKLSNLLDRVEVAAKKFGYLLSVDGRWGRIRSKGGDLAIHTALNVLLQMTGSLVMKWSNKNAEDVAVDQGIISCIEDFPIVAHQHDEAQMEIPEEEIRYTSYIINKEDWKEEEKRQYKDDDGNIWSAPVIANELGDEEIEVVRAFHPLGSIYCKAIQDAGKLLGLRCPTDGEYMIGDSWKDTH
jgi:hypothetical protein